jgi:hypothetical protein
MTDLERCLAEQRAAQPRAIAGDAGARLWLADWCAEECLLLLSADAEEDTRG